MSKSENEIRREALRRQGSSFDCGKYSFFIPGGPGRAEFEQGSEGLVQLAIDENTRNEYRLKCFWEPSDARLTRSKILAAQKLANLDKSEADALAGAPFEVIKKLGPNTPFAVIMKNVKGLSWKNLKLQAEQSGSYPPANWPALEVRATWAYGLATAVKNLEAKQCIHADLSPGNVMVTASGDYMGDMALVDFDSFIHPSYPYLDSSCLGSDGYAAPEVREGKSVVIATDRLGMAILIQEFLVVGDASITKHEAFDWGYDQQTEIGNRRGDAHPLMKRKYPELARLLARTLQAPEARDRPEPEVWRPYLYGIAEGIPLGPRLQGVVLRPLVSKDSIRVVFDEALKSLDLAGTSFGIRATLERDSESRFRLLVHSGAEINVQTPAEPKWKSYPGGARITVVAGITIFDRSGKLTARIEGQEC